MRGTAWLALACALAAADARATPLRPYTIEDVLSLEKVGRAAFLADGTRLVFELQRPWKTAGSFDLDAWTPQRTSRLFVVNVVSGGAPEPLLPTEEDAGQTLGAASPDSRRLIVFRVRGRVRELGVVEVERGTVRWSGLTVEAETFSVQARWRDDHEIVVLATTPETPSLQMGRVWQSQARTISAWSAMARGERSVSVVRGGPGAATNPAWPDVDFVAMNVESGTVRHLARGPFSDFSLAPGAARAALVANAEPVSIRATSPVENYAADRRRRLVLVDLGSGQQIRPCPTCDVLGQLKSWSPDGRALIICARPDDDAGDWRRYRYWRISVTGQAQLLSTTLAPDQVREEGGGTTARLVADAAWLGQTPAVLAAGDTGSAWWRIQARGPQPLVAGLASGAGARLSTLDAGFTLRAPDGVTAFDEHGRRRLADAATRVQSPPAPAGDLPQTLLIARAGQAGVLSSEVLSSGGDTRPAAPLPDGASLLALSPTSGAALGLVRTPEGVSRLVLATRDRPAQSLVTLNAGLAEVDAAPPVPIPHLTPDGQAVTSWLYLPASHGPADDRPVIIVPYPGASYPAPPAGAPDAFVLAANVRAMVGAGYAVLTPSLPLARDAEPAQGLADAMLAAVDAAHARVPGLSKTRLAVWGQSFGGFGALAAATQSSRFKAVIASSATADMVSKYGAQGAHALVVPEVWLQVSNMFGWSESGQARMAGPPWSNVERYVRASPLLHADQVTAPVMLIEGDRDGASTQAEEMFAALYRQGKAVELRYYLGEGHVVLSPANVRDLYQNAFRFLQDTLSTGASATVEDPGTRAASGGRVSQ